MIPVAARSKRGHITAGITVGILGITLGGCVAIGLPAENQLPSAPTVFDNSDPSVLVTDAWYLFGSSNNKNVPVRVIPSPSQSLADSQRQWATQPRDAMPARPAWVDPTEAQIWAPHPTIINGIYFLYFAARHGGVASDENNDQCIGRARASSPMGPYDPEPEPLYCGLPPEGAIGGQPPSNSWGRGALDPEVFQDVDGRRYLIATVSRTKNNIVSIPLSGDGYPEGGRNAEGKVLASQRAMWHDGVVDDQLGSTAFLENPSMVRDPFTGTYLLFYSAGQWYTDQYVTGIARCKTPTGPCSLPTKSPFLVNGNGRSGVGGLTAFTTADGAIWTAYATWTAGHESQSGSVGEFSRQTHFAPLMLGATTEPKEQTIQLQ